MSTHGSSVLGIDTHKHTHVAVILDGLGRHQGCLQFAASPVQASSGQRQRHRLSRGGDRQANSALWTIANNRMIHDETTRAFAERRRAKGDSRKDTLRVLKRYIARETFSIICSSLRQDQALSEAA